ELGLTLLLSSHLLTEVEQLCNRIAVLNKGRKVFEGGLEEVQRGQDWVFLQTDAFDLVVTRLTAEGLVVGARDGRRIALASGVPVSDVVRRLVELGHPVHGIGRETLTLEEFYLSLMKEAPCS
ncbi:MAG: ABC transporter ATP-binding protein, partial [Verrucomicrobiota bacterium]